MAEARPMPDPAPVTRATFGEVSIRRSLQREVRPPSKFVTRNGQKGARILGAARGAGRGSEQSIEWRARRIRNDWATLTTPQPGREKPTETSEKPVAPKIFVKPAEWMYPKRLVVVLKCHERFLGCLSPVCERALHWGAGFGIESSWVGQGRADRRHVCFLWPRDGLAAGHLSWASLISSRPIAGRQVTCGVRYGKSPLCAAELRARGTGPSDLGPCGPFIRWRSCRRPLPKSNLQLTLVSHV